MDLQFQKSILHRLLSLVKQNIVLTSTILILQLLSISLFSYLLIASSITVSEDLQKLTDPLSNLNLEDPNISEQEILTEGAKMISAYNTLSKHVAVYFFQTLLLFFTLPGFIWALTLSIINGDLNAVNLKQKLINLSKNYLHYLKTTSILFLPLILVVILIAKFMLESDIAAFTNAMQVTSFLAVIITIIALAALSVRVKHLNDFKRHFVQTKDLLTKNLHFFLATLIIAALPICLGVYFLYYATLLLENFPLMLLAALFTLSSLVFARFYLVLVARELVKR